MLVSNTAETAGQGEKQAIIIAMIVAIASFMQVLDSTIISTAIPGIARSFHTDAVMIGSGVVVYVLAASIVIPACAWLSDRVGAKRLFVCSFRRAAICAPARRRIFLPVMSIWRCLCWAGSALWPCPRCGSCRVMRAIS